MGVHKVLAVAKAVIHKLIRPSMEVIGALGVSMGILNPARRLSFRLGSYTDRTTFRIVRKDFSTPTYSQGLIVAFSSNFKLKLYAGKYQQARARTWDLKCRA
jgi:hypothetical protein